MLLKTIICILLIIELIYDILLTRIVQKQRKKPLPKEVADVYDDKRYQTFLNYKAARRKSGRWQTICDTVMILFLLFSPFFTWLDTIQNPYLLCITTYFIVECIEWIYGTLITYYDTFVIDEKYGMNKMTKKKFWKDHIVNTLLTVILSIVLYSLMVYLLENIRNWTNNFHISWTQSLLFTLIIVGIGGMILLFSTIISIIVMKKQYAFHELEKGILRDKIEAMLKSCKKKVRKIEVYDESKVSTRKNAFLLKFLWIREFGIADNFIIENSEDELLAVLGHEIGHLKHKKNILDLSKYTIYLLSFLFCVWLIHNGNSVASFFDWICDSMHVSHQNYYVILLLAPQLLMPIGWILKPYFLYVSRKEEYEADASSVHFGYGKALIKTFKELSQDELVDVNPADMIEFFEYDHPSMYHRIIAIEQEMKKMDRN